ncbi:MAG: hypothetical protein AB7O63_00895 [Reyranellaceae bacterium]
MPPVLLLAALLALIGFLYIPTVAWSFVDWSGWALAELHVNYAAGPVRRGLPGEIAWQVASLGIPTRDFFAAVFIALAALQAIAFAALAWPLATRHKPLFVALMLSPALLLFPAYDTGAWLRKDMLLALGILLHTLAVRRVLTGRLDPARYRRLVCLALAPALLLVTLAHELQIVMLPLHMALVLLTTNAGVAMRPQAAPPPTAAMLSLATVAAVGTIFVVAFRGDAVMAQVICDSWQNVAPIDCLAVRAIGMEFSAVIDFDLKILNNRLALVLFALAFALSLLPAVALSLAGDRTGRALLPLPLMALGLLPLLTMFVLGWDWGRWIHLIALSAVALLLATPFPPAAPGRTLSMSASSMRRLAAGVIAWVLALAYVGGWRLRHCCEIANLDAGLYPTFVRAIEIVGR